MQVENWQDGMGEPGEPVAERVIHQKRYCLKMDCIDTYYSPEKNTMTSDAEQLIGYGLRLVID